MGNSFGQQPGAVPEGNFNGYQPGNFLELKSFKNKYFFCQLVKAIFTWLSIVWHSVIIK